MKCCLCENRAFTTFAFAPVCKTHNNCLETENEMYYNYEILEEERKLWKLIKPHTYHENKEKLKGV